MPRTPDPATQTSPIHGAAAPDRPTLRAQIADNPLLSFLGAIIVLLLTAAIASPSIRINDTNRRIDRLEDRMQAEFAKIDTKISELDAKIDTKISELDAKIDRIDDRIDRIDDRIDRIELVLTKLVTALEVSGTAAAVQEADPAASDGTDPPDLAGMQAGSTDEPALNATAGGAALEST